MRVVISGQMPPPVGGQNLNVKRFYDLLESEPDIQAEHWRMEFTKSTKSFRKLGVRKLVELVRVVFRLCKLRLGGKIDVIIYSTGGPHLIPIIRDIILLPMACLMSEKVWVHFQAAGIAKKLPTLNPILRWLLKRVHGMCYGGLALSTYGKEDPASLGIKMVDILYNGLEDHTATQVDIVSEKTTKTGHETVMLYVGHLCQDKGVPVLIRAFAEISKSYPDLRLRLVGQCLTPYTQEMLDEEIRSSRVGEKIQVTGLLMGDALQREYRDADIVVFPSVAPYESFGLVLVEAMIWELPIIASNWRAAGEIMGEAPGGICYEIGDSHESALEKALFKIMKSPELWTKWGQANRRRYEKLFSLTCLRSNLKKVISS